MIKHNSEDFIFPNEKIRDEIVSHIRMLSTFSLDILLECEKGIHFNHFFRFQGIMKMGDYLKK